MPCGLMRDQMAMIGTGSNQCHKQISETCCGRGTLKCGGMWHPDAVCLGANQKGAQGLHNGYWESPGSDIFILVHRRVSGKVFTESLCYTGRHNHCTMYLWVKFKKLCIYTGNFILKALKLKTGDQPWTDSGQAGIRNTSRALSDHMCIVQLCVSQYKPS